MFYEHTIIRTIHVMPKINSNSNTSVFEKDDYRRATRAINSKQMPEQKNTSAISFFTGDNQPSLPDLIGPARAAF